MHGVGQSIVWTCPSCGLQARVRKFPVRCACGFLATEANGSGEFPSLAQRLSTFAKAASEHQKLGRPKAPSYEVANRFALCQACEKYSHARGACGLCGCRVNSQRKYFNKAAWAESRCPLGKWDVQRVCWVTTADLVRATVGLLPRLPADITRVVGVPRSGMLPASVIATHLQLPLYALQRDGSLLDVGGGFRMRKHEEQAGRTLLVDDTVGLGTTLKELLPKVQCDDLMTVVIFAGPQGQHVVDLFAEELVFPHLLEWNMVNSLYMSYVAFDLDGIICENPPYWGAPIDDPRPLLLPRFRPVQAIITSRPEAERPATVAWLARWSVQYNELIMWPKPADERTVAAVGRWKAAECISRSAEFYVESEPEIAAVMRRRHVRVLCPREGFLA